MVECKLVILCLNCAARRVVCRGRWLLVRKRSPDVANYIFKGLSKF